MAARRHRLGSASVPSSLCALCVARAPSALARSSSVQCEDSGCDIDPWSGRDSNPREGVGDDFRRHAPDRTPRRGMACAQRRRRARAAETRARPRRDGARRAQGETVGRKTSSADRRTEQKILASQVSSDRSVNRIRVFAGLQPSCSRGIVHFGVTSPTLRSSPDVLQSSVGRYDLRPGVDAR